MTTEGDPATGAIPLLAQKTWVAQKGLGDVVGLRAPSLQFDWILDGRGQAVGYVPAVNPGGEHPFIKLALRARRSSLGPAIRQTIREEMQMVLDHREIVEFTETSPAGVMDDTERKNLAFAAAARGEGNPLLRILPRSKGQRSWLNVYDPSGRQVGGVDYGLDRHGHLDAFRFLAADPDALLVPTPKAKDGPQVGYLSVGRRGRHRERTFCDEVVDDSGVTVARFGLVEQVGTGRSPRLEKLSSIDEPLNSLLLAYVCAPDGWRSSIFEPGSRSEPGI